MARKKEFDQNEVLEKAMETFWCKGYEATSIQDLVEAMGINRGSLYDTFQDKRSLFLAAIAHYDNIIIGRAIARLEAPDAAKQAIVEHFFELVEGVAADAQRRGCLMTNSAVELAARDPETATHIAANLHRLETAFYKALVRAQEKGEISSSQNPRALARFFTCNLQGLRVVSKVNPDLTALRDMAKVVVSVLD